MLKEDQTAELLVRCETKLGKPLVQIRGLLKKPKQRASAIWELLVMDATMNVGTVTYEPKDGGSPDLCLIANQSRPIWLEVAYRYPRFQDLERRSRMVGKWICQEAKKRKIPNYKIILHFDGISGDNRGSIRNLPLLQEKNKILKHPALLNFFRQIKVSPNQYHECSLFPYSVKVEFAYQYSGPYVTNRGLQQEAPKSVEEHAVFIALEEKAKQHQVDGPYIVCIGSDQSPALSRLVGPGTISMEMAVNEAFKRHSNLSGTIIVSIAHEFEIFGEHKKKARVNFLLNPRARHSLRQEESRLLEKLNFNTWAYGPTFEKWETDDQEYHRCVRGSLTWRNTQMGLEIEIPVDVVVEALAGKKSLIEAYRLDEKNPIYSALKNNWKIISCKLIEGNMEKGEPKKLVLELTTLPEIFWPKK
jgi:hypothetical protein